MILVHKIYSSCFVLNLITKWCLVYPSWNPLFFFRTVDSFSSLVPNPLLDLSMTFHKVMYTSSAYLVQTCYCSFTQFLAFHSLFSFTDSLLFVLLLSLTFVKNLAWSRRNSMESTKREVSSVWPSEACAVCLRKKR